MLRKLSALVVIIMVALALVFPLGSFLVVGTEQPERAALCHVLAGDKARTVYAAKLYRQGLCATIVLTGGYESQATSFAGRQKAVLLDLDVPDRDIMLDETDIFSTFAEIERLNAVIDSTALPPAATVSLVSEPYHMRRARMVAAWLVDPRIRIQMAPVPFDETPLNRFWVGDSHSRNTVMREYAKLLYYQLRYRLRATSAGDWLASLETVND